MTQAEIQICITNHRARLATVGAILECVEVRPNGDVFMQIRGKTGDQRRFVFTSPDEISDRSMFFRLPGKTEWRHKDDDTRL